MVHLHLNRNRAPAECIYKLAKPGTFAELSKLHGQIWPLASVQSIHQSVDGARYLVEYHMARPVNTSSILTSLGACIFIPLRTYFSLLKASSGSY
jgi:hypothetical protein